MNDVIPLIFMWSEFIHMLSLSTQKNQAKLPCLVGVYYLLTWTRYYSFTLRKIQYPLRRSISATLPKTSSSFFIAEGAPCFFCKTT